MPITMTTTNAYADLVRNAQLSGGPYDISPKYVALGTGSATPAATDTQLGTETFRKAVTSVVAGGAHGELLITLYLDPTDAVTTITEVGVFAGVGATGTANSGTLMGRALYSHPHTNTESVQLVVDWIDQQV